MLACNKISIFRPFLVIGILLTSITANGVQITMTPPAPKEAVKLSPEKPLNVKRPMKKAIAPMTELEKQQAILAKYKPLIQKRSYSDLIVETEDKNPLVLKRLPVLGERLVPGKAPNLKVIPFLLKSFAHPAYLAEVDGVRYILGVSCEPPVGFDDCSTVSHNLFKQKQVYVRFIQSNDPGFSAVSGMRVGSPYQSVLNAFSDDAKILGHGECVATTFGWAACFDAENLEVDRKRLTMMPAKHSKIKRFIRVNAPGR